MNVQRLLRVLVLSMTLIDVSFAKEPLVECHFVKTVPGTDRVVPATTVKASDSFGIEATLSGLTDGDHVLHTTIYDGNGREYSQTIKTITASGGRWSFVAINAPAESRAVPGQWNFVLELDGKQLWVDFINLTKNPTSE